MSRAEAVGFDITKFIANFDVLGDAPQGVRKLRELVLDLAVRGRLIPQANLDGVNSEPPPERNVVNLGAVDEAPSDLLFPIPRTWTWISVGHVCEDSFYGPRFGKNDYVTSGGIPTVRTTDMTDAGEIVLRDPPRVRVDPLKLPLYLLQKNDLLITRTGSIGTMAVFRGGYEAIPSAYLIRFRFSESVTVDFMQLYLRSPFGQSLLGLGTTRVAQPNINATSIRAMPLPMPPLAEQKRIVAKVDELMHLLDDLEAKQIRKQQLQARLRSVALDALTSAQDSEEVAAAWQRVAGNFEVLFEKPDAIADLKGAVRNLALRGVLTAQSDDAVPASLLLDRIAAERNRLVRAKTLRRTDPLPSIEADDVPFNVPRSWCWTRLGALCLKVADGPHFSPEYVANEDGIAFLSGRNIKVEGFDLESVKYVSCQDHAAFCERIRPERGDVLYTKGGTTGVALVNDLDFEFSVWVHVAVLKLDRRNVFPKYVALALNSPHCYAQSQKLTHGTGNRDLGLTRMVLITLPLPPHRGATKDRRKGRSVDEPLQRSRIQASAQGANRRKIGRGSRRRDFGSGARGIRTGCCSTA